MNSQDLKKQEQQLKEQIQYQQTILTSLQQKAADQKKLLESDKQQLIEIAREELKESVKDELKKLAAIKSDVEKAQKSYKDQQATANKQIHLLNAEVSELQLKVDTEKSLLETTNSANLRLVAENNTLATAIDSKKVELSDLQKQISQINTQLAGSREEHSSIIDEIDQSKAKLEQATSNFEAKEKEYSHKLNILLARAQEVSNQIIDDEQKQKHAREELATWEIKLQKQDQNLRVREEKLTQRDKVLIRNAGLLNM